jgi:hypothetical protein
MLGVTVGSDYGIRIADLDVNIPHELIGAKVMDLFN